MNFTQCRLLVALLCLLCTPTSLTQDYYGRSGPTKLSFKIPAIIGNAPIITITETSYITDYPVLSENCPTDYLDFGAPPITITQQPITVTKVLPPLIITTTLPAVPHDSESCDTSNTVSDLTINNPSGANNFSTAADAARTTVTDLVITYPLITAGLVIILTITVFSCCMFLCAIKCSQARKNARRAKKLTKGWSGKILKSQKKNKKGLAKHKLSISNPFTGKGFTSADIHAPPKLPNRNSTIGTDGIEMDTLRSLQRDSLRALAAAPKQPQSAAKTKPNPTYDSPDQIDLASPSHQALLNENFHDVPLNDQTEHEYVLPDNVPQYRGSLMGGPI